MKKICKIILMVCSLMLLVALQRMSITALAGEDVTALLSYSGHVQTYGDLQGVQDGDLLGTTGESKRIEALSIQKAQGLQDVEGDIVYRVHVQSFGTQEWVRNGAMAGTKGQCKRIEAVQMYLTGELAEQYDIYYAVHCQTYGWSKWTKGSMEDTGWCGTSGLSKRVEAVRVLLVKKDEKPAMSQEGVFSYITLEGGDGIVYSGHRQTFGDLNPVSNGGQLGNTGCSKRLEALQIALDDAPYSGSVLYRTHVQGIGWQSWLGDGQWAGTKAESKRLEAIEIKLSGEIADYFDVWYQVHIQGYGWLDWAKNGQTAGSSGISYRMEAVRIKLLPKGSAAPGNTERYYTNQRLKLVAIDAGHQRYANLGQEPEGPGSTTMKTKTSGGATGTWTGTPEYQVTLDVSLMLQQELISRGYQTVMIRTSNDVDISNIERANIANNSQADAFVRIHCNSSENSSTSGALTICMSSANPYCAGLYSASRNLSQLVLNSLCARSGAKALGAGVFEMDDMTGINWSKVPVTIVELGYLSNRQEEQKLIDKNYQAALAAGIADGIAAFLK